MSESNQTNSVVELRNQTSEQQDSEPGTEGLSRRNFLGVGSAGLASAALAALSVNAQDRTNIAKAEQDEILSKRAND